MKKLVPMLTLGLAVLLGSSAITWAADETAPAAPATDSSAAQPGSAATPMESPAKKPVHKKKHVKKHKKVHKEMAPAAAPADSSAPAGGATAPAENGAPK